MFDFAFQFFDAVHEFERHFSPGQVQTHVFGQGFETAQTLDVNHGIQPLPAPGARRPDQAHTLVMAQRLGVDPNDCPFYTSDAAD